MPATTAIDAPTVPGIGAHHRKNGRGKNPRSLANLRPAWMPGQSGNARGRPPAGSTLREWLNTMQEWTGERLEAAAEDTAAPAAKRAAARVWLTAISADLTSTGRPIATDAVDLIFDRTVGRPCHA